MSRRGAPLDMRHLVRRHGRVNGPTADARAAIARHVAEGRRAQPEAELQKAVVDALTLMAIDGIFFAVPNGGARTKAEAGVLKATGVRAGVGDLCLMWCARDRVGGVFGLDIERQYSAFIELKAPGKKPRLSAEQVAFAADCERLGVRYGVAQSLEEVEALLTEWRVPRRRDLEGKLLF